jgi:uncharacterized paraquat-inducible protein A
VTFKLTCPQCDTYTSAVFQAYTDGDPCPHCGAKLYGAETARQYYDQLPEHMGGRP